MRLFKNRNFTHHLSKSNNSAWFSKIAGAVMTLIASGIFYGAYTNKLTLIDSDLRYPVYLFLCSIIMAGVYIFIIGFQTNSAPKYPLIYDPLKIAKQRIFNSALGFQFIICFSTVFIFVGFKEPMFLLIGSFILLLTLIGLVFEVLSIIKLIKKRKKYGSTSIQILTGPTFIGDEISFKINNQNVYEKLESVEVVLRNLTEKWERRHQDKPRGKKNSKILKTYIINETIQEIGFNKVPKEIKLKLPSIPAQKTNYSLTNPTYWELCISNTKENFWSRFFIEVL